MQKKQNGENFYSEVNEFKLSRVFLNCTSDFPYIKKDIFPFKNQDFMESIAEKMMLFLVAIILTRAI